MSITGDTRKEFEEFKKDGFKEVLVVIMKDNDCICLCQFDEKPPLEIYKDSLAVIASAATTFADSISKSGSTKTMSRSMLLDAIKLIELNPDAMVEASELKREP